MTTQYLKPGDKIASDDVMLREPHYPIKPAEEVTRDLFNSSGIGTWEINSNNGGDLLVRIYDHRTTYVYAVNTDQTSIPASDHDRPNSIQAIDFPTRFGVDEGISQFFDNLPEVIEWIVNR
jgi:hypothetical protein